MTGTLPRRLSVVIVGAASAAASLARWELPAVLGAILLAAVILAPEAGRSRNGGADVLGWLPIALPAGLGAAAIVMVLAALVDVDLWGDGRGAWTLALALALATAAGCLRGGRVAPASRESAWAWLLTMPMVVLQVIRASRDLAVSTKAIWQNTDWVNHGEMVLDMRQAGALDYLQPNADLGGEPDIYPRGLHAALAWTVDLAGGQTDSASLWIDVLVALASVGAFLLVFAMAGAALVTIAFGRWLRAPRWVLMAAPAAVLVVLYYPRWFVVLGWSGFLTTTGAVLGMYALVLVAGGWGSRTDAREQYADRLVLAVVLSSGLLHLWQGLVLPAAVVVGYLASRWWRAGRHGWVAVGAVTVLALLGSVTITMQTLTPRSVDQAGAVGGFLTLHLGWSLVLIVVAITALTWRLARGASGRDLPFVTLAVIVTTTLMGLVLLVLTGGEADSIPYYPGKLLLHAELLALPVSAAAAGLLLDRWWIGAAGRARRAGQGIAAATIIAVPLAVAFAFVGGPASVHIRNVMTWVTDAGGSYPLWAVAPLRVLPLGGDPSGEPVLTWWVAPDAESRLGLRSDWHAAQLARSVGYATAPQDVLIGGDPRQVCAWLSAYPNAVRVTGTPRAPALLMEEGCPVDVVRPGEWRIVAPDAAW